MVVAMIGAGNVGMALGARLVQSGEEVVFGLRSPEKRRDAIAGLGARARTASVAEAYAAGELLVLAVPYEEAKVLARTSGGWGGKVVVDATNPLKPALAGLSVGTETSGAEQIQALAPQAKVVKAFNTTGAENMLRPEYPGGRIFMPVAGNDAAARARVIELANRLGFEAVDMGELAAARYLEPFAMAWLHLAIRMKRGRNFAFGLLAR